LGDKRVERLMGREVEGRDSCFRRNEERSREVEGFYLNHREHRGHRGKNRIQGTQVRNDGGLATAGTSKRQDDA
jgi:hypothetical protein